MNALLSATWSGPVVLIYFPPVDAITAADWERFSPSAKPLADTDIDALYPEPQTFDVSEIVRSLKAAGANRPAPRKEKSKHGR